MAAAAQLLALAIAQENHRVPRNFRIKRAQSFNLPDVEFVSSYRLTKRLALELIEEVRPYLEPRTSKKTAFSVEIKVLCALRFFATGSDQRAVSDDFKLCMSQQSVSKNLRLVTKAIEKLMKKYVKFPTDRRSQEMLKQEFFEYCDMTGVLGAIDCTHVAIIGPSEGSYNENDFVNRKGFHSINVQLVCDMKQKILNVMARFPGSSHDAYIWKNSNLRSHFQLGRLIYGNGWLLGDSGYPREAWLKTPIQNPSSPADETYNFQQSRGRSVVERLNGTLKSRFRCLKKERTLHYNPTTACEIINACVVLHNMCIENNLEWDCQPLDEEDLPFNTGNGCDYQA